MKKNEYGLNNWKGCSMMKKAVTMLILVVMMVVVTTSAYAASTCSLCGRTHELQDGKCPEACTYVSHGNSHHYYDCPDGDLQCSFCGDQVSDHNTNTCPNCGMQWLDQYGVWKTNKYVTAEMNGRSPIYCGYCRYYGYHYESECLRNPNRVEVTATSKPVVTPRPTATPKPTATPCTHSNYVEREVEVVDSAFTFSQDYCFERSVKKDLVCTNCGKVLDTYYSIEKIAHKYNKKYTCTMCNFNKPGMNTPMPTATPKVTAIPNVTSNTCLHEETYTEYYGKRNMVQYAEENRCHTEADIYVVYCRKCNAYLFELTDVSTETLITEHYYQSDKCSFCGYSKPATVTPTPTVVPTTAPTSTPTTAPMTIVLPTATPLMVLEQVQPVNWVMVLILLLLVVIVLLLVYIIIRNRE